MGKAGVPLSDATKAKISAALKAWWAAHPHHHKKRKHHPRKRHPRAPYVRHPRQRHPRERHPRERHPRERHPRVAGHPRVAHTRTARMRGRTTPHRTARLQQRSARQQAVQNRVQHANTVRRARGTRHVFRAKHRSHHQHLLSAHTHRILIGRVHTKKRHHRSRIVIRRGVRAHRLFRKRR